MEHWLSLAARESHKKKGSVNDREPTAQDRNILSLHKQLYIERIINIMFYNYNG